MDRARLTLLPSGRAHSELQDIVLVIASLPVEELGLGKLKVEVTKCYWLTLLPSMLRASYQGLAPGLTLSFTIILCSPVAYSIQWFIADLLTEQTIFTDLS